ncbi:MAG: hypothetical protein ACXVRJ_05575 [Gaiellaceae bacterium]
MDDNGYDESGPPFEGRGADLHAALEDAWERAKGKTDARTFKVESIVIEVENPIRTYIVIIDPTG